MRSDRSREGVAQLFPGLLGLWLAFAPIKFGTPVVLDDQVASPESWLEVLFQSWPVAWAYGLFALVFTCGCLFWKWRIHAPRSVLLLPVVWLVWQMFSAAESIRPELTFSTIPHFMVCVAAFYLGAFALGQSFNWRTLWLSVAGGWLVVVAIGWKQHFGGLAEMREYFYSLPNWREQPPELIAKIASNRIFSTLFYPNALAGALLLFTPPVTAVVWTATRGHSLPGSMRLIVAALPVFGAAACLLWSGSKAGWLIALGQAVLALALAGVMASASHRDAERARANSAAPAKKRSAPAGADPRSAHSADGGVAGRTGHRMVRLRWLVLIVVVVVAGVGGFWLRYQGYFKKGATSVTARFDYWAVAGSNALARAWLGSGPGTFMEVYRRGKPPEAEMTRLTHNDYLQQATDSGIPAALLFLALVGAVLWRSAPLGRNRTRHPIVCGVWLGIAGIAAQSTVEFGLYIPAIAWPWFLAMGALVNRASPANVSIR